jgi:glucosamine-6-phosphate deaminase
VTPEVHPEAAWADHVAALLAERLTAQPDLVVCLPTGSTPLPIYDRLPAALRDRGASADDATVVALDEFLGLPAGHRTRCDEILHQRLVRRLGQPGPRFVAFDVDGLDPEAACAAFDRDVARLGGLDLVVLGLGRNGHVGMNEPGSATDAPTRVVALAPSTRAAAIGYGADPPPTHGVTLGMAAILAAREVWLLATGTEKASILRRTIGGPATTDIPASLLRGHPALRVIVDEAAAGG